MRFSVGSQAAHGAESWPFGTGSMEAKLRPARAAVYSWGKIDRCWDATHNLLLELQQARPSYGSFYRPVIDLGTWWTVGHAPSPIRKFLHSKFLKSRVSWYCIMGIQRRKKEAASRSCLFSSFLLPCNSRILVSCKSLRTKHDESRCDYSLNMRFWCAPARFIRGLPIWQYLLQISYAVTGLSTATPGCCITAYESIPRSFGSYRASA